MDRTTFIQSQIACAMIELEAMKAANRTREVNAFAPAYGEKQFMELINKYGIEHNTIINYLKDE